MESGRHEYTDPYGYRCCVDIVCEDDDIVVFDSTPPLSFDFKKHGIKIRRSKHHDYVLRYALKQGQLYLRGIETRLSFFHKKAQIFGVNAKPYPQSQWHMFLFDDMPVAYSGTLRIGKTLISHLWEHDEKASPVPFSPEAYKENGYIRLEKGIVVEKEWESNPD